MIAVTGASGKLGHHIVSQLVAKNPQGQIVAWARHTDKAKDLAARGVQVRRADYAAPETIASALAGVKKLVLVSSSEVGKRHTQHITVIEAAKKAGVELIAYTSLLRADTSKLMLAAEHLATEKTLRASGIPFVILRNGWYIENYTENVGSAVAHGAVLGAAENGKISAASRADYAAAAVAVITREGHAGRVYELGGDSAFTMAQYAEEVSRWAGKPIAYKNMPVDDYKKALIGFGMPEPYAAVLADSDAGIAKGELETSSRDLHELIGRDTETVRTLLARTPKPLASE